jgi:hypothetical protein
MVVFILHNFAWQQICYAWGGTLCTVPRKLKMARHDILEPEIGTILIRAYLKGTLNLPLSAETALIATNAFCTPNDKRKEPSRSFMRGLTQWGIMHTSTADLNPTGHASMSGSHAECSKMAISKLSRTQGSIM